MAPDLYLLVFALAFLGCVLATPVVTRLAQWAGAIDRPDQFRRIHKGATPRLGGLGLAFGIAAGLGPAAVGGFLPDWPGMDAWLAQRGAVAAAVLIILAVGAVDDTRGIGPRVKLLGQALAVVALYAGGIRIESIELLGRELVLSRPIELAMAQTSIVFDPVGFGVTMVWFLGCMNVWNLIDGMDGLASGVGLLVSTTLMLVAYSLGNYEAALLAAALSGGLAGFLLYNWHPACIFLGDSGALLIGMLLGIIGIKGTMQGTTTVSILVPILAMGLPISDTALAIFRRWVRNLPMTAADRRHVHHLLIGLGLNPRQAAALLYCFTAFLCGVVLMGVAARSDFLALGLGLWGVAAFLLILYSRRNELAELRSDVSNRFARRGQERSAAKITYEAIQRIELCEDSDRVFEIVSETTKQLGCIGLSIACAPPTGPWLSYEEGEGHGDEAADRSPEASGMTATFRLVSGGDLALRVVVRRSCESGLAADIAFRFIQRLSLATTERLGRLLASSGLPEVRIEGPSSGLRPVLIAAGERPKIGAE